ncbi:DUF1642 domain-containing protein [Lactococcus garvieae]|nr:DUF1642 domain-containing protein [Lactococcus garvieae]
MKKFEEELNNGLVSIGQNIITKEYAYGKCALINYFKDWISPEDHQAEINKLKSQLEKQRPEIPEFMAKVVEEFKKQPDSYKGFSNVNEVWSWLNEYQMNNDDFGICGLNNKFFVLAHFAINGYTVAKEKRFYLKNKLTGLNLVEEKTFSLTGKHVGERFREFEMQYIPTDEQEARLYKNTFTQQEINSMETGSYEQIEVEE